MESTEVPGKNMSKAREAFNFILGNALYPSIETFDQARIYSKDVEPVLIRDEGKPVVREHDLRAWGHCPVCNASVGLPFHRQFCGDCGTRLIWGGKKE